MWGTKTYSHATIQLNGGSLPILNSLLPFLNMVAKHEDFKSRGWWWIDSLCINLEDKQEREKQITIMADIYKKAKRAIIWLGQEKETGSDCTGAVEFLHRLADIQVVFNGDDNAMRQNLEDPEFATNCAAVSRLFFRPWWTRVRSLAYPLQRTSTDNTYTRPGRCRSLFFLERQRFTVARKASVAASSKAQSTAFFSVAQPAMTLSMRWCHA